MCLLQLACHVPQTECASLCIPCTNSCPASKASAGLHVNAWLPGKSISDVCFVGMGEWKHVETKASEVRWGQE